MAAIEIARFRDLSAATLYEILQLRSRVFVVEQECVYLDIDGRDTETATLHLFVRNGDGRVRAYVRVLAQDDGTRKIGRVVAEPEARGTGVASEVMAAALAQCGDVDVVLDAQAPLAGWYAAFGFTVDGPEFLDDGILHVPMRRHR